MGNKEADMRDLVTRLDLMKTQIKHMLDVFREEYDGIEEGRIVLMRKPNKTYLCEEKNNKRRSLTKDKKRARELVRREYLRLKIDQLDKQFESISETINALESISVHEEPENRIINRYADTWIDPNGIISSKTDIPLADRQSRNPYYCEDLRFETNCGIRVRTLSEQIIGNIYEELMIPYFYEMKLVVDVTELGDIPGSYVRNGRRYKDYYPDFVVILADGTLMIHEHFGLIDKEEYRIKNSEKIMAYTSSGLVEPGKLLLTYPSDIRKNKKIREFLLNNVKPYI